MAREPVLAAGGIVLRPEETPLIAVVRLRKRNEWVLPKGRLDDDETARVAAEREVLEETGHEVSVHEFLGTLVYESGGRSRVVHYWRMESGGEQVRGLMDDIRAVDWLPLEAAVERLSRGYEQAFLAHVGPLALEASALARLSRQPRARKPPVVERPRRQRTITPAPDSAPAAILPDETRFVGSEAAAAESFVAAMELAPSPPCLEAEPFEAEVVETEIIAAETVAAGHDGPASAPRGRTNLMQKVRDWLLRRAA